MRIKGKLATGLIIALALTLVPITAFPVQRIIPGTTCKVYKQKMTYQSKSYTCIKSGKKLVWSKGVIIKSPTPIPTQTISPTSSTTPSPTISPTPAPIKATSPDLEDLDGKTCSNEGEEKKTFYLWLCTKTTTNSLIWYRKGYEPQANPTSSPSPTTSTNPLLPPIQIKPWQENITESDLIFSALEEYKNWAQIPRGNPISAKYYLDENVPSDNLQIIRKFTEGSVNVFGDEGASDFMVLVGASDFWITNKMKELGLDFPKIEDCTPSNGNRYCSNGRNASIMVLTNPKNHLNRFTEISGASHEYFHVVMGKKMNSGTAYSVDFPAWFFEGAPSFFASAVGDRLKIFNYAQIRDEILQVGNYDQFSRKSLSEYKENESPPNYPYGIGQVAIEFIVASCGMQCVFNVYKKIGEGKNFNSAFELSTGLKVTDFYRKFDFIQQRVGIKSYNN